MSYSFSADGADKTAAKAAVAAEMAQVVASQPVHAKDAPAALEAANKFVDLLQDDPTMDVHVSMHGSVGWRADGEFTSTGVGISAYLAIRKAPAA